MCLEIDCGLGHDTRSVGLSIEARSAKTRPPARERNFARPSAKLAVHLLNKP